MQNKHDIDNFDLTLTRGFLVTSDRWHNVESYGKDDDYDEVQLFRTKSYPEDPFLSEIVSFRKKHAEPKLKGPMWVDANIEVKIGDMGNATFVVSIKIYRVTQRK